MEDQSTFSIIVEIIVLAVQLVAMWKVYVKMGEPGWKALIPIYSGYVLFKKLYGNGWKVFLLLIPLYNIYVTIKLYLDFSKAFGKSTGFAIGLIFLNTIFYCILGFDKSEFTSPV